MTFPPHIQAAIDAGPLQSEQGKDEWTRRQLFASRIARMVAEHCATIGRIAQLETRLVDVVIRAAFGLGEKP